jgi:hypothetical protein
MMNLTDIRPGDLVFNIWKPTEPLIVLGPTHPPSRARELPHLTRYQISSVICLKPNGTTESINKNNLRDIEEYSG